MSFHFRTSAALFCLLLAGLSTAVRAQEVTIEEQEETAVKAAIAAVAPSVVRVEAVGGAEIVGKNLASTGPTTGVIVDASGYIVSSAFNFISDPASILVTLPSGKRAAAEIVARDHARMLVLLKVKTDEELPVPAAVPRDQIRVGQTAIALGRTFDSPLPGTSVGVISAVDRVWGKAVQTDAKISPSNYGGALVDLRGRVFGILVPLSPHGQGSEVAGAEWYDSGIGFAVPLADVFTHLEKWKAGKDLHPGLLGINLKPGDIYVLPAEIAACQYNSPAAKAGLKVGDVIIEADGKKIDRQAQLKHVLGPHYAGDKVHLVARRGSETITADVELAEKLEPYTLPFLGLLPAREKADGVTVRWVYPGSPADEAGVKVGDRIVKAHGEAVANVAELRTKVASWLPTDEGSLSIQRGEEALEIKLTPKKHPIEVPDELPPPFSPREAAAERPAVGTLDIKLPEAKNDCWAYVPENYHPDSPHGLVIWLPAPREMKRDEVETKWKDIAAARGLVILAPRPADPTRWEATETEFIGKAADDLAKTYNIDASRVSVLGEQAGGGLAWLLATQQPERIRGLALVEPTLPRITQVPEMNPVQPLFLWAAVSKQAKPAQAVFDRLTKQNVPVSKVDVDAGAKSLSDAQLQSFARWVDTLDRL